VVYLKEKINYLKRKGVKQMDVVLKELYLSDDEKTVLEKRK